MHCKDGCSALQERLQCTASETGKRDSEITSPILDKREGRRDTPHMGLCSPTQIYLVIRFLLERFIPHCLEGTPL